MNKGYKRRSSLLIYNTQVFSLTGEEYNFMFKPSARVLSAKSIFSIFGQPPSAFHFCLLWQPSSFIWADRAAEIYLLADFLLFFCGQPLSSLSRAIHFLSCGSRKVVGSSTDPQDSPLGTVTSGQRRKVIGQERRLLRSL